MAGLLDSAALMDPTPKAGSRVKVPKSAAKPKEVKRGLLAPLEDFLGGGQARRKWLNDKAGAVTQFIPPELRPWVGAADMMNPISDIGRAGQASTRMMAPGATPGERFGAGVDMVTDMASVLAPAIGMKLAGQGGAKALQEALVGVYSSADDAAGEAADAWRRFAADESGAMKVWHGGGGDIPAAAADRGAWFSEAQDLAGEYAGSGGRMSQATIDPVKPIAFRHAEQSRPIGDVISTALDGAGDLSDDALAAARPIVERLQAKYGDEARPLFEYWNKDKDVSDLFRTLGYDSISAAEKADMKAQTWGMLDPSRIVMDTPPTKAQEVAEMLASGRGGEVTDGLLAQADPSELWRLYDGGKTGQAMPMDEASRMARAEGMGFDTGTPLYHGTGADIQAFDLPTSGRTEGANWHSTSPTRAAEYAPDDGGSVIGGMMRGEGDVFDYGGRHWQAGDGNSVMVDGMTATDKYDVPRWDATTDDLAAASRGAGKDYAAIRDVQDPGPYNSSLGGYTSDSVATFNPANIRSKFARFDPRLKHLANLSAAGAGAAYLSNEDLAILDARRRGLLD